MSEPAMFRAGRCARARRLLVVVAALAVPHAVPAQRASPARVAPRPILDIGGVDATGAAQLARVRGVMRLSSGVIVIADAGSSELRFFTATGTHIRSASRRGSGPGEVEGFDAAFVVDDTIYALDERDPLVVFDSAGRFMRSVRPRQHPAGTFLFPRAVMRGGLAVGLRSRMLPRSLEQLRADSAILTLMDSSGADHRRLASYPRPQAFPRRADGLPMILGFTPEALMAGGAGEACAGYSQHFVINCFDSLGQVTRRIVQRDASRPVNAAMRERLRNARSGVGADGSQRLRGSQRTTREGAARELQFARTLPEFSKLLVGRDDRLWVRIAAPEDYFPRWGGSPASGESRWRLFDRAGKPAGEVVLPTGFDLFDAGADWVLGVQWDEDDAEHVVMYRLLGERR